MKEEYIKQIKEYTEKIKPQKGLKNVEGFKKGVYKNLDKIEDDGKFIAKKGNVRLSKRMIVYNIGSWLTCPSRTSGKCPLGAMCYASEPEIRYHSFTSRFNSQLYFKTHPAEEIATNIIKKIKNSKTPIDNIRFNEVGDMESDEDLKKLIEISNIIYEETGINSHTYTHNKDLNFDLERPHLVINGSNFMADNNFFVVNKLDEKQVKEKGYKVCPCVYMDKPICEDCDYCMTKRGDTIIEVLH